MIVSHCQPCWHFLFVLPVVQNLPMCSTPNVLAFVTKQSMPCSCKKVHECARTWYCRHGQNVGIAWRVSPVVHPWIRFSQRSAQANRWTRWLTCRKRSQPWRSNTRASSSIGGTAQCFQLAALVFVRFIYTVLWSRLPYRATGSRSCRTRQAHGRNWPRAGSLPFVRPYLAARDDMTCQSYIMYSLLNGSAVLPS